MSDAFDKKFREKLSDVDIPFDADAWNKMEKKLDALNDDGSSRRTFWWWLAPLLLLLLGTGAYLWWQQSTPRSASQAPAEKTADQVTIPQQQKEVSSPENKTIDSPGKGTGQSSVPGQQVINTPAQPSHNIASDAEKAEKNNAPAARTTETPKARVPSPLANRQESSVVPDQPGKQQQIKTDPAKAETDVTINEADKRTIPDSSAARAPKDDQIAAKLKSSSNPPVKGPVKKADESSKEEKVVPPRKGFSIGVVLGPVFNVAPSMWYGRFGVDGGLLLSYHVNNRWSFTTGAIYSVKPYGGTLDDYGVSKRWPPPTNPNYAIRNIDANCNVLDVPVNINYTFMDRPKYALSASAGMSSYFMLKEKYNYKYQSSWERDTEITNENRHYMAVLNLAFTYQFPISNHMSLGIQPFAKVPLRGVGYGEVKLYSTGVLLQLNFNRARRTR